jgi:hypothetical protein
MARIAHQAMGMIEDGVPSDAADAHHCDAHLGPWCLAPLETGVSMLFGYALHHERTGGLAWLSSSEVLELRARSGRARNRSGRRAWLPGAAPRRLLPAQAERKAAVRAASLRSAIRASRRPPVHRTAGRAGKNHQASRLRAATGAMFPAAVNPASIAKP